MFKRRCEWGKNLAFVQLNTIQHNTIQYIINVSPEGLFRD